MITCKCGSTTQVLETRDVANGIWRRRQCKACKQTFTTYEQQCDGVPVTQSKAAVRIAPKPKATAPARVVTPAVREINPRNRMEDARMERELADL